MKRDLTARKMIALTPELARRIDDYRFENRFRNEADALRSLIEAGLEAESAKAAKNAA